MKLIQKPLLLLAGAPRSGTSFLHNLLKQHPAIREHYRNESYFFMDKDHPLRYPKSNFYDHGMENYWASFSNQKHPFKYLLDGTDQLLYQREMIPIIKEISDVKMIFILREPASRILSSFEFTKHNLLNFKQDISFEEYVEGIKGQDQDKIKNWFYSDNRSGYILKRELKYSHYETFLKEWIEAIGQEQIYIVQFEAFTQNIEKELSKMLTWLHLENSTKIDANKARQNASVHIKHTRLHRLVSRVSAILPRSSIRTYLKYIYLSIQKKEKIRENNILETLQQLKKEYAESNERLAKIAPIDLFLWK